MRRPLLVLGCFLAIALSTAFVPQIPAQTPNPNPVIGTWKLNAEKSSYSPGLPPPKGTGAVRQYAAGVDGSIVAITFNIDVNGLPSLGAISAANYDGREYVQHTVATLATSLGAHIAPRISRTISYTPKDPYTVQIVQKQDGKVVGSSTRTISRDGKTLTDRSDYTDTAGNQVRNVLVVRETVIDSSSRTRLAN